MVTEQRHQETQGRALSGLVVIALLVALLWMGGSPWRSVQAPPSEAQMETAVAVNAPSSTLPSAAPVVQTEGSPGEEKESPAAAALADVAATPTPAPVPTQPESGEAQVAREREAVPSEATTEMEVAKTEPEPPVATEKAMSEPEPEPSATAKEAIDKPKPAHLATAEKAGSKPEEPSMPAEEAADRPEPEQSAAEGAVSKLEPEPSAQEPVRMTSPEKETRRRSAVRSRRQARLGREQQARGRASEWEPRFPIAWIYEAKTATPLLSRAAAGASVVRQLKPGEQLRVIGSAGNYFKVQLSEEEDSLAYVHPRDMTLVRTE